MKKILIVTSFLIILLVSFLGITYSYEYNGLESLSFELIGPSVLYVDVGSEYQEYGIKVIDNGVDISSSVNIDSSLVNTFVLGEYRVKYEIDVDGYKEYVYRDVKVIDKVSPVIKLNGEEVIYVIRGGTYLEYGYDVSDNYDKSLNNDSVIVSGSVNTSILGEYRIKYSVVDSSGNKGEVERLVVVVEPEVTLASVTGNRYTLSSYDVTKYTNTITKNKWIDNGIYYYGYVKDIDDDYKIKLKNRDNGLEYLYDMSLKKDNYYDGNIDLTLISNGEYDLYIISGKEYRLLNKMDGLSKLFRAKIGDKLVTLSYDNDCVSIIVKDFKYEYDILIDPGHGGYDVGASNGFVYEKDMNLIVSKYEKCRYESMGYKVYMTRYDDTYGEMMGSNSLDDLQRRALTMGYYGVISRVSYSNHHNAIDNNYDSGFEILVSNKTVDLEVEKSLYNKYIEYYGIRDNVIRLYSKDYNTEIRYNKLNGNVYSYMDYYAMIRIPGELFNEKVVIYEPIYISNLNDFNWYWNKKKWIDVAEIKIREYVSYLGGEYISDNSMCI